MEKKYCQQPALWASNIIITYCRYAYFMTLEMDPMTSGLQCLEAWEKLPR
jgi:hypothetical protein